MLIHIGYHKTATTWLQQCYFPHHPQLRFAINHEAAWTHLMAPHSLEFDVLQAKQALMPSIELAQQQGKIPVLSAERLSGNPHSGGYDNKELADRLYQLFPTAKILIVIRHQTDAILSNYKQYIRMNGICRLEEYLNPPQEGRIPLFRLDNFKYHFLVDYYVKLYGRQAVKIMLYEQFKTEGTVFIQELSDFLGIQAYDTFPLTQTLNPSFSDLATVFKRKINWWGGNDSLFPVTPRYRWLTKPALQFITWLDGYQFIRNYNLGLREKVANQIAGKFAASNAQLQSHYQLPLTEKGYEVA